MSEADAIKVQEKLRELRSVVCEIDKKMIDHESTIEKIVDLHRSCHEEGRVSSEHQAEQKVLYPIAITEADEENTLIRKALSHIADIRNIAKFTGIKAHEVMRKSTYMKMLKSSAHTLPLWVGRPGERPPPLVGAIPADTSHIAEEGDMVAALVKNVEENEYNWILAVVVSYNPSTRHYEVKDIDDAHSELDDTKKGHHILNKKQIIPLPTQRANPVTEPEALFPIGSVVMALYPQTTCFYKAIVNALPTTLIDDYELLFEDTSYADNYAPPLKVPQRYIIAYKKK